MIKKLICFYHWVGPVTRIRLVEGGENQTGKDWETNGSTRPGGNSPGLCYRNVLIRRISAGHYLVVYRVI